MSLATTLDHSESRFTRKGGPQLFIVVASTAKPDQLASGLSRLLPAARAYGAQVLVVGSATPNKVYDLTREHTGIRYIMAAPGLTRNDLLSVGVAETSGGVVVLTDDACLPGENWHRLLALRLGFHHDLGPNQNGIPA